MRRNRCKAWAAGAAFVVGASAALLGCTAPANEQTAATVPEPAVTPVTSVNELMVTWIDNASHVLWDVEQPEFTPKNDADWIEIEDHATQVAAAGTLIQLGGTGQADPGWIRQIGWQDSARAMSKAGLAIRTAARERNLDGVIRANGDLVASCESCHDAFKPELPSEGIAHQRPHSESHRTR